MNNFIGNHIKFIVEWGQLVVAVLILIAVLLIRRIVKKNKFYLPKGIIGWLGTIFLFFVILFCSLVFIRIATIKPGALKILSQLDKLKGEQAPPLTFKLISDNSEHTIQEYRGSVVLVNYWATWCTPCLGEMPDLNQLQEDYKEKGLVVVAISDETRESLNTYIQKRPLKVVGGYMPSFNWVNLGSERPASFLIDKEGIIREYFTGAYDYVFFKSKISKYLNK